MFIYHFLFTLVLKSPNGEWPITYTFTFIFHLIYMHLLVQLENLLVPDDWMAHLSSPSICNELYSYIIATYILQTEATFWSDLLYTVRKNRLELLNFDLLVWRMGIELKGTLEIIRKIHFNYIFFISLVYYLGLHLVNQVHLNLAASKESFRFCAVLQNWECQ